MAMIPANLTQPSDRKGYLLFNPGGPGEGPSQEMSDGALEQFWRSSKLHKYFDIVGPDPRGTGLSQPVTCDPDIWNYRVELFPQNQSSFDQLVSAYKLAGESCANMTGDILNFIDTASAARDLEAIRIALGNDSMNYIGFSYGSQLGSQYAELFPDNVRAMVLDGDVDHSQGEIESLATEIGGFETTLGKFFAWCKSNDTCALHSESDLPSTFKALIDRANISPIPAPNCSDASSIYSPCRPDATGNEMVRTMQSSLIFPESALGWPGWGGMSVGLKEAIYNNNSSKFSNYLVTDPVDSEYSYVAIFCQDWMRSNYSYADWIVKMEMGGIVAPLTRGQGEFWYLQARCMSWPAPVTNPPHSISATFDDSRRGLKTPILLTNTFYDPETPFP